MKEKREQRKSKTFHCFFEQSGTFKNEFRKLGYEAYDYDISNEFGETDRQIDLFVDIEEAYKSRESVFDEISDRDTIIAFFPCIRFENQIELHFRGTNYSQKNWSQEHKLEYDLKLHKELSKLYELITKLAIVCIKRKIPLIIENPYSTTHYLVKYWSIESKIIDRDRTKRGDYFKKPTQYWFINCEPKQNMILEAYSMKETKTIGDAKPGVERSLIAPEYANRFIREFIVEEESM